MSSNNGIENHLETVCLYLLQALTPPKLRAFKTHLTTCGQCAEQIESLRPLLRSFVSWPTDVLRPSESLWERLSERIGGESGGEPVPAPQLQAADPDWKEVGGGISCKILSVDQKRSLVTMLVRLAPGNDYPPHRHADAEAEELHLLDGELISTTERCIPEISSGPRPEARIIVCRAQLAARVS